MEILIIVLILVAFSLAAMRWGFDSREPITSREWEKRQAPPFAGHHL